MTTSLLCATAWRQPVFRLAVTIAVFALLAAGCARRPVLTVTAVPGPSGSVASEIPPAAAPRADAPATPTPPTSPSGPGARQDRPAVTAFKPAPALTDIHFDFDRYEIRPGDGQVLDEHARWLKANTAYLVLIEGHADDRGTNEYNMALGDRRAKATLNYLVAQGVHERRLTTITSGEERPACIKKTEDCWARNRRAHFLVKSD
jgi:peptidoglycan-associated lipoprotein